MQLRNRTIEYPQPLMEDTLMFFDTETTGLPSKKNKPYIIQLAYILYDKNKRVIIETYSKYIKLPESVEIDPQSIKIHGINKEKLEKIADTTIEEAMDAFCNAYNRSIKLIGHNVAFDINMVKFEMERLGKKWEENKERGCTMLMAKMDKWPKLEELYERIYRRGYKVRHEALEDVRVCMRCYEVLERVEKVCKR